MPSMPRQFPSDGISGEAQFVARTSREQRQWLTQSNWLGFAAAREELGAVWDECQTPNWDGFDAFPISQATLQNAFCFLDSLPLDSPAPSIGAEPDGDLTFEWHRSPRYTLSISVTADGDLHYAGLFGPRKIYGTVPFFGDAPDEILQLIEQVQGA